MFYENCVLIENTIKSSQAQSRVSWLQEETNVLGTISVPIIRVVM
jgi:hypothetical protein